MIPTFPHFKKLTLNDIEAIESFTQKYPPYSDFDFISMWSWNCLEKTTVSQLHGNLIVKFPDYLSDDFFYSFLGTDQVNETVETLLDLAEKEHVLPELKLVPEPCVVGLDQSKYSVREDSNHTDYVLAVDKLITYEGIELSGKRRAVSQFTRRTPDSRFEILDLKNRDTDIGIKKLFSHWLMQKNTAAVSEEEHEYVALCRCIESQLEHSLIATGVFVDNVLEAFWILGDLNNTFSISHFEKARTDLFVGIFPYLKQKTAEVLKSRDIRFINLEQDLGIVGLRTNKMSYFPELFLKKYTVQRKPTS